MIFLKYHRNVKKKKQINMIEVTLRYFIIVVREFLRETESVLNLFCVTDDHELSRPIIFFFQFSHQIRSFVSIKKLSLRFLTFILLPYSIR